MLKQFQRHFKNSWMMNEILEDCEKIKQNTYLPLKKGKVKKLENYIYQSDYSSFLEKKKLEYIRKQKTAILSRRDDE